MQLGASSARCNLSPSISVSLTLPSVRNPVGSQSTLASEIEHHRPIAIKGPHEMMALKYDRYSTPRGRRGWRKRSGFSCGVGKIGIALVRLRNDAYHPFSLIRQLMY
jgi:hypothetical protein